jgi:hypothetical protein
MMKIEVQEVASHRNGCTGEPFHAVRFTAEGEALVALVFAGAGQVAVIDPARAVETVAFAANSWRGDWYEPALRVAVENFEANRCAVSWGTNGGRCDSAPMDRAEAEAFRAELIRGGYADAEIIEGGGTVIYPSRWKHAPSRECAQGDAA